MTVRQLQNLLQYLGYYSGGIDGDFGPLSKQATENFQRDFGGIAVDGIVGTKTEKALKHAVAYGMPGLESSAGHETKTNEGLIEMTAVEKILKTAVAEIGTKENPANSNRVKYNTEYYGNDIASANRAWCCAFVWWVFKHAGYSALFYDGKKCAGCTTLMNFYKSKNQIVTGNYKPGDLVFFQFDSDDASDHIGIIERDNGDTVVTIEGNTSAGNDSNGGEVMRRTRKKSLIMAVARPAYPDAVADETKPEAGKTDKPADVTVTVPTLRKNARGESVRALQLLLIGSGMDCGKAGADGIFGSGTDAAVKAFQRHHGLTVDGIVGKNTWSKLLAG
jgi:peptidoglycan hydrolase-like protein with peptidoglycan-binding domain